MTPSQGQPADGESKQLEDAGIIERYVAVLNARNLGLDLDAFVEIRLRNKTSRTTGNFEKANKLMPEVVEAYFLTGDSDYLLRVRVKDTDHYRGFLRDHLLKIPKVESAQ